LLHREFGKTIGLRVLPRTPLKESLFHPAITPRPCHGGTDQKKRASFDHEDGATWAIQARDPGRLRTPDALAR
jgi:hypothetical protein